MGNIWGTAQPGLIPAAVIPAGAVALPAPGAYAPLVMAVLTILLGATPPSALKIAFKLGSGSDVDSYVVEPALLVTLAELVIPVFLAGVQSPTAWVGSGSTLNLTVNATGQAVTC